MRLELSAADLADKLDAHDDPVVWRCQASRVIGPGQVEFRNFYLTESARDALLAAFGPDWLARHLAEKEAECAAFGKE